ncbi:MAG: hypothetical protein K0R77_2097 [Chryseobacterium sp.]|jgi:hypothetical protein|uniref:hypothetical protein n=1 Tax=Chryseobacterium sp. TaxID=1871047 RepID=UPI002618E9C5|nr:hypothetical protein [Chryseobacterium sp.]MDF2552822.1 hypothetical protein [Chryseobacterium sp.]
MQIAGLRGKSKDQILELFDKIETAYDSDEWVITVSKSWFGLVTQKLCIHFDHEGKVEAFFGL